MFLRRTLVSGTRIPPTLASTNVLCAIRSSQRVLGAPSAFSRRHGARQGYSRRTIVRERRAVTLADSIRRLECSALARNADAVRNSLDDVLDCLGRPDAPQTLPDDLRAALADARVSLTRDTAFYGNSDPELVRDVHDTLGQFCEEEYCARVLDSVSEMTQKGDTKGALNWLSTVPPEADGVRRRWEDLLAIIADKRDEDLLFLALDRMHARRLAVAREVWRTMFDALFRQEEPPDYPTVKVLLEKMKRSGPTGVRFDRETLQIITEGYKRAGQYEAAEEFRSRYILGLAAAGDVTQGELNAAFGVLVRIWNGSISTLYRRFRKAGLKPSQDTLLAVLQDDATEKDIAYWERMLIIKAGPRVREGLIGRRLSHRNAVRQYQAIVARGSRPTATLLDGVIGTLLADSMRLPSEDTIDRALHFYHDFVAQCKAAPREHHTHKGDKKGLVPSGISWMQGEHVPKAATYTLLLRAVTSNNNLSKYLPIAVSLVEDMRRYGIRMPPKQVTSLIVLLMRSSSTPQQALEMYRSLSTFPNGTPVLNDEGYGVVLSAFCKLPTWPGGVPAPRLYFELVRDMRTHRIPVTARVYTVLLAQLASLATRLAGRDDRALERERVARAIVRAHNHLALDAAFSPDTPLWNQLMDAYQRAGCFPEAYSIWQQLLSSGKYNEASISIILDACAFAKAYDQAVRVYTTLAGMGYALNVRHWNTFLECLCRLGRLDEALKVLCLEMTGQEGVEPDVESVRILLKFAMQENRSAEVKMRVKRFLPKLWLSIPDEVKAAY